jgi:hypothetical protein
MARKFPGHTPGYHTYRLCPYSQDYKERYYDLGYLGNSTNPNLPVSNTSVHPDTDGEMITANRGVWGFMCMDDSCWFYLNTGVRYFEV